MNVRQEGYHLHLTFHWAMHYIHWRRYLIDHFPLMNYRCIGVFKIHRKGIGWYRWVLTTATEMEAARVLRFVLTVCVLKGLCFILYKVWLVTKLPSLDRWPNCVFQARVTPLKTPIKRTTLCSKSETVIWIYLISLPCSVNGLRGIGQASHLLSWFEPHIRVFSYKY